MEKLETAVTRDIRHAAQEEFPDLLVYNSRRNDPQVLYCPTDGGALIPMGSRQEEVKVKANVNFPVMKRGLNEIYNI